jgi:hypothetical protein
MSTDGDAVRGWLVERTDSGDAGCVSTRRTPSRPTLAVRPATHVEKGTF